MVKNMNSGGSFIVVWFIQHHVEIRGIPNRSVLVTGCNTGFGNLLAKSLDPRGVRVFACFEHFIFLKSCEESGDTMRHQLAIRDSVNTSAPWLLSG